MNSEAIELPTSSIPAKINPMSKHPNQNSYKDIGQTKAFKNDNVLFQIHSPKGVEDFNAKTFPAKFSINITNETNELGTGQYNSPHWPSDQPIFQKKKKNNAVQKMYNNMQNKRQKPNNNVSHYEKVLKDYKEEYDRLAEQAEENCDKYEKCIRELEEELTDRYDTIEELKQKLQQSQEELEKVKSEEPQYKNEVNELKSKLKEKQSKIGQVKEKLKKYEKMFEGSTDNQRKLLRQINLLESALSEKDNYIREMSESNNDNFKKMLKDKQYQTNNEIRQLQKWLKGFNKTIGKYQQFHKQEYEHKLNEMLIKLKAIQNEKLSMKSLIQKHEQSLRQKNSMIKTLQRDSEKKSLHHQQLQQHINQLKSEISNHNNQSQQNQYNIHRVSEDLPHNCASTVKVKIQLLLREKDRLIKSLESQIQSLRKINISLNTHIHKLQYKLNDSYEPCLNRVKSERNYLTIKTQDPSFFSPPVSFEEIHEGPKRKSIEDEKNQKMRNIQKIRIHENKSYAKDLDDIRYSFEGLSVKNDRNQWADSQRSTNKRKSKGERQETPCFISSVNTNKKFVFLDKEVIQKHL